MREDIIRASAVVIIGLSLDYDLDLKRIVYGDSSKKVVIIDADNITQNKKDKLSKFGTVYAIGINEFANQLNTYKLNSYVETPANDRLINFCQNSSTNLHKKVNVQLMRDFLMWGKFDEALLGENVKGEKHIVFREDVDRVIDSVKKNIRVVFLHSNLGNGKTVFLEMLKKKLYDLGISTYEFIYQAEESIVDDLERIRNVEGKKVIIVENYFNHLSLLKQLSIYLNDEVTYVFTARTMIYDAKLNDVIEMMSLTEGQSEVIDINKLNNNELQQCYRMFENNSFWGDYTGHNKDAEKWKALKQRNKGKCEFNSILLEVMHSSDIQKRLIDLTDEIKKVSGSYYKCLIMMLISSVMSLELSADDIQNILNNSCFSDPLFIDNASVKELVGLNIRGNRNYKIKSAIVASEILRILDSNEDIISALISISEYADIYWRASEKYESILKNIVSFSHIKSFLKNKRNNIEFINDYYNALKNIGFHKENSFFWVQFSIATMYYGDYDLAQRYIDVAYKYFRAEGDNVPFQCDNQQARIKLLMIEDEKSSNVLDDFKNAHSLAMKPCKNIKDREESVIRLFKIYVDKRFIDSIEKAGLRDEYKKACGEAYNRTASFLKTLRNERDRDRYNNLLDELLKASTI